MVHAHRVAFFLAHGVWPDPQGCHSCDNPPCCNPNHIFAGTNSENHDDMVAKGRHVVPPVRHGSDHPSAKLTAAEAAEVRLLYAAGGISQYVLAQRYGVTQSAISKIVRRQLHR